MGDIGTKAITLSYTTKVCDPCVFANNTQITAFKNTISTTDMKLGSQPATERSFSGLRRGAKYLIKYPGGTMTVDVPVEDGELPKVILPDGTKVPLTADYDPVNPDGFGGTGGAGAPGGTGGSGGSCDPVHPVETENPEKLPIELPDPNVPNAPKLITIMKDGVPKIYQKVWDSKTETWVYILDEDVPQAGDNTSLLAAVMLFSGVALATTMTLYQFLRLKKRKKK